MEMYLTYHKVLDKLEQFQQNYCCLNSFGYGNLVDFGKNVSGQTVSYPYLFVVPLSVSYDQNTTTYQLSAIFADRLNENLDNEKDAVSDMSLAARQLLSEIWRGNLQDYFDAPLPVNGQPFMERFNDYVAGVALDLNLIVYEDINACEQWIVVTPSVTPSMTPTITPSATINFTPTQTPSQTSTPTVTPTITRTPQVTPTPSSTPATDNPAGLGAMWWIDFTDASTLTVVSSQVTQALDKVSGVTFSAGPGGPIYTSTGYLGVSGTVQSNAVKLENSGGTYSSVSDWTWFGRLYDDGVSQRGGKVIVGAESPGFLSGPTLIVMQDDNSNPYPPGPIWNFQDQAFSVYDNIAIASWTNVAMRSYYSGASIVFEIWENGSIIQGPSFAPNPPTSINNPVFSLMYDGGIFFNTEQFFFNKKLSNAEMTQMFNYLNNKY